MGAPRRQSKERGQVSSARDASSYDGNSKSRVGRVALLFLATMSRFAIAPLGGLTRLGALTNKKGVSNT